MIGSDISEQLLDWSAAEIVDHHNIDAQHQRDDGYHHPQAVAESIDPSVLDRYRALLLHGNKKVCLILIINSVYIVMFCFDYGLSKQNCRTHIIYSQTYMYV